MDLAAGLEPGKRFRCGACGNLTRFDVLVRERVRRFWHVDLSGEGNTDEEELLEREVESVACRWCGSAEHIEVVEAPGAPEAS